MSNKWRYYEGTTSSGQILKDMAKVLCTAVKDRAITDADGNIVKHPETIPQANWDIVYPMYDDSITSEVVNIENPTPAEFDMKIMNQLSKSTDTIILKTKTSSKSYDGATKDDLGLENDLAVDSIEMYMEIYKPKYLADPEKFHPETERMGTMPYLVTKDIYKDYASTTGEANVSLHNTTAGAEFINAASPETLLNKISRSTTTFVETDPFSGVSGFATTRLDEATALSRVMKDLVTQAPFDMLSEPVYEYSGSLTSGATFPTSGLTKREYAGGVTKAIEIPLSYFAGKDSLLSDYLTVFGMGTATTVQNFKEKYSKIKATVTSNSVTGVSNGSNYPGTICYKEVAGKVAVLSPYDRVFYATIFSATVKATRPVDLYKVDSGFSVVLKNADKIDETSITVTANGTPQSGMSGGATNGVWSFNKATGKLAIPSGLANPAVGSAGYFDANLGQLIEIKYEYEKEQATITDKRLVYNNHCLYVRIFDKYDEETHAPVQNVVDPSTGEITQINCHASEWSKLSWYQDFEEVLIDELDTDVGGSDLSQGTIFLPIQTPGLNSDTRLRFWANTSNNRASIVFMGNPSLDFSANRHLTSMFYVGQIESFQNSINDTAGNFALMTSSSTVPCDTKTKIERTSTPVRTVIPMTAVANVYELPYLSSGQYYDEAGGFVFYKKGVGETIASQIAGDLCSVTLTSDKQGGSVEFLFNVPGATEISTAYSYYQDKVNQIEGIVRDGYGNILEVKYPETWGKNTATGVTDVCMLHTRSKAYFQKHHFMFTSTEEYMTKEMYGKSAYTGEYYADRIKITHGNDGPRGMLQDVLVIDQSSLVALDELIVNRDFEKDVEKPQETYVFFPINAPYSPFSGSPNSLFGLAIKKAHIDPAPLNDEEAVQRAIDELYIGTLTNTMNDIVLPTVSEGGVTITWTSSDEETIAITTPA